MNEKKSRRGFAGMNPERQRAIASQGGHAAHERGAAHEFTPEQARTAGKKGGETISKNRQHMAEIGRLGGIRRAESRRRQEAEAAAAQAAQPEGTNAPEAPASSSTMDPPASEDVAKAGEKPPIATAPAA